MEKKQEHDPGEEEWEDIEDIGEEIGDIAEEIGDNEEVNIDNEEVNEDIRKVNKDIGEESENIGDNPVSMASRESDTEPTTEYKEGYDCDKCNYYQLLQNDAIHYQNSEDFDEAIKAYEKLISILEGNLSDNVTAVCCSNVYAWERASYRHEHWEYLHLQDTDVAYKTENKDGGTTNEANNTYLDFEKKQTYVYPIIDLVKSISYICLRKCDYAGAMMHNQRAMDWYDRVPMNVQDRMLYSAYKAFKGQVCFSKGDLNEALNYYTSAIEYLHEHDMIINFEGRGPKENLISWSLTKAQIYHAMDKLEEGKAFLDESEQHAKKFGIDKWDYAGAEIYEEMASVYKLYGLVVQALKCYHEAIMLCSKGDELQYASPAERSKKCMELVTTTADFLLETPGFAESSMIYYEKFISNYRNGLDYDWYSVVENLWKLVAAHQRIGSPNQVAYDLAMEAVHLAHTHSREEGELDQQVIQAQTDQKLGDFYKSLVVTGVALDYYKSSYEVLSKLCKPDESLMNLLSCLAWCLSMEGRYEESIHFLVKLMRLRPNNRKEIQKHICTIYVYVSHLQEASKSTLMKIEKAVGLCDKWKDDDQITTALKNLCLKLGDLYHNTSCNQQSAIKWLVQAFERKGDFLKLDFSISKIKSLRELMAVLARLHNWLAHNIEQTTGQTTREWKGICMQAVKYYVSVLNITGPVSSDAIQMPDPVLEYGCFMFYARNYDIAINVFTGLLEEVFTIRDTCTFTTTSSHFINRHNIGFDLIALNDPYEFCASGIAMHFTALAYLKSGNGTKADLYMDMFKKLTEEMTKDRIHFERCTRNTLKVLDFCCMRIGSV